MKKDLTLLDYWLILYRRKKTIYLIVVAAMLSAAILSYILPGTYEAKSVFFIPRQTQDFSFYSAGSQGVIRSRLEPQPQEEPHAPYIGMLKSSTIIDLIREIYSQKTFDRFKKDIDFVLNDEYMIEVYVRDKDPKLAADIANAYPEKLNKMIAKFSLESANKNRQTIKQQIEKERRQALEDSQKRLQEYQEKNKVYFGADEITKAVELKTNFIKLLDDSMISLQENIKEIDSVQDQLKKESNIYVPEELVITTPLIEDLKKQLIDLEVKITGAKSDFTESHPVVVTLKEQYAMVQANIEKEIDRLVKSQIKSSDTFLERLRQNLINLYIKKETVQARISALQNTIAETENRIKRLNDVSFKLDELTREVELNKELLKNLQLMREEVAAQEEREIQNVVIVDKAAPPAKPVFPILWLNVMVAGILGLITGVFFCFFLNYIESIRIDKLEMAIGEDNQ